MCSCYISNYGRGGDGGNDDYGGIGRGSHEDLHCIYPSHHGSVKTVQSFDGFLTFVAVIVMMVVIASMMAITVTVLI